MKSITKLFFVVILFTTLGLQSAYSQKDTVKITNKIDDEIKSQTMANFDSLLSVWYVKKSIYKDSTIVNSDDVDHDLEISDSLIIDRLNKIASPIEMTFNPQVRSWIDMYLKRGKYMLPTFLSLETYYFPFFEQLIDANDMPLELKYLPIIESALNPTAVSRAGATGLWQFLYSTGKMYGLEINSFIDERRDPVKSTYAAVAFMSDLYEMYGDWQLVLAAYNCGPGNVNKAMRRSGGTNFWEIYDYLPKETRGYVPAFIAATYVMTYANEHNYYSGEIKMPIHTDTIMINDTLHLLQVAEVLQIPIEKIRDLNPQYKKDIIPGHIKPYPLRLPIEETMAFVQFSDSIYAYNDSLFFKNRRMVTPPSYVASSRGNYSYTKEKYTPCDAPNLAGKSKVIYTVKSGDNFGFIANWYNVSVNDLKCWNDKNSNKLSIGEKITVYVYTKKLKYYQGIERMTFDQKQNKTSTQTVAKSKASGKQLDKNYIYYTIKSGDNISTIAKKFTGVSESNIKSINSFSDRDVRTLQIGQIIKIKRK